MTIQKTSKEILSNEDILKYIADYESKYVPHMNDLWEYYKGKNVKILSRKTVDPNNPDNRIIASYGRKLVITWTGYGYRSKYITYKPNISKTDDQIEQDENIDNNIPEIKEDPIEKKYLNELQEIFNLNNEHIKTNRMGRNKAIFGVSYELLYIDAEYNSKEMFTQSIPKFFTVDPREMIVLYDFSPEPKIKIGIRYYKLETDNKQKVEVYYKDHTDTFFRERKDSNSNEWVLKNDKMGIVNFYDGVPIIAYQLGDEMQSIMECVLSYIDAYDVLMSDSMNEFDRFAFAYLIMKKFGLSSPLDKKDPTKENETLKNVKRRKVFEHLDKDADIKFLTKDIPTAFIEYMAKQLKEQIHLQSHVPDFTILTGALSGAAIDRLLFDFENLISSDEADCDTGLIERGTLITKFLQRIKKLPPTVDMAKMVVINHKRNLPLDRNSFADLAEKLSRGGFSRKMIVSQMPGDMVPDVEQELKDELKEAEALGQMNAIDNVDLTEYDSEGNPITDQFGNPLETNKTEGA